MINAYIKYIFGVLDSVLGSSHLDPVGLNEINNQALTKGYLDFISLTLI